MERLKIFTTHVEEEAMKQIELMAQEDNFKDCKIRIMPDVHGGKDVPIGTTIQLNYETMIAPSLVGVDIGCGISAFKFKTDDKIDYEDLDNWIKQRIPLGFHRKDKIGEQEEIYRWLLESLYCKDELVNGNKVIDVDDGLKSLGTLGGGNHYIEIGYNEDEKEYLVTIHSGSRSVGSRVAGYYMSKAKEVKGNTLKYLNEEDRYNYLHDMAICKRYASINRSLMLNVIEDWLAEEVIFDMDCVGDVVHNFIDDDGILRKGAVSAQNGQTVIIPINMRDGVLLGCGKGNEDYNYSAPHGAGRIMSRSKAKKNLSLEEFEEDMKDVFTTSVNDKTLDESPRAYKKLEDILPDIENTVEILGIYKTVYNIKG